MSRVFPGIFNPSQGLLVISETFVLRPQVETTIAVPYENNFAKEGIDHFAISVNFFEDTGEGKTFFKYKKATKTFVLEIYNVLTGGLIVSSIEPHKFHINNEYYSIYFTAIPIESHCINFTISVFKDKL